MKSSCNFIIFHFIGIKLITTHHSTKKSILYKIKDNNITEKENLFEYLFTNQVLSSIVRGYAATFSQKSKITGIQLSLELNGNPANQINSFVDFDLLCSYVEQETRRKAGHLTWYHFFFLSILFWWCLKSCSRLKIR